MTTSETSYCSFANSTVDFLRGQRICYSISNISTGEYMSLYDKQRIAQLFSMEKMILLFSGLTSVRV